MQTIKLFTVIAVTCLILGCLGKEAAASSNLIDNSGLARQMVKQGLLFQQENDLDSALRICKKAVGLDPELAEAHFLLGQVYMKKGLHNKAIASYQHSVHLDPQYGSLDMKSGMIRLLYLVSSRPHDEP